MALWERGSNGQANSVTQSSCCIETCNACCCPAAPKTVLTCSVHSLGLRCRPRDCAMYDEDDIVSGLFLGLGLWQLGERFWRDGCSLFSPIFRAFPITLIPLSTIKGFSGAKYPVCGSVSPIFSYPNEVEIGLTRQVRLLDVYNSGRGLFSVNWTKATAEMGHSKWRGFNWLHPLSAKETTQQAPGGNMKTSLLASEDWPTPVLARGLWEAFIFIPILHCMFEASFNFHIFLA